MTAGKLYRDFRGRKPGRTKRAGVRVGGKFVTARGPINIDIPKSLAVIGHVNAIEYDTTRDGRTVLARHKFARGSRPLLMVGGGHGQIFLVGSRFKFTDRGIMDIDEHGRLIDGGLK